MLYQINYEVIEQTQKVYITPETAADLLAKNFCNRKISINTVEMYANVMSKNDWKENNPQPIVLTKTGYLLDGQHRLSAVVKSGITLSWNVYIINKKYIKPLDIMLDVGKKRTISEITGIQQSVSSAIKQFLIFLNKRLTVSPIEIEDFYSKYVKNDEYLQTLLSKIKRPLWSTASYKSVALALYLTNFENKNYVIECIEHILNNEIDKKPIITKVLVKVSERTFSQYEHQRIAIMLFSKECENYKIVKLTDNINLSTFYKDCYEKILKLKN